MSIWNKILLVLIFLVALGVFYLGAKSLKLRSDAQKKLREEKQKVISEQEAVHNLLYGMSGQDDGYIQLNTYVNTLRAMQGASKLFVCKPADAKAMVDGINVSINVDVTPTPTNLMTVGTIVYLFDSRTEKDGGVFLGEFKITQANEGKLLLGNNLPQTQANIDIINSSIDDKADWIAYTRLPLDQHAVFEGLSQEDWENLAKPATIEKFNRSERPLEPIAVNFYQLSKERDLLLLEIKRLERHIQILQEANADAIYMIGYYDQEQKDKKALIVQETKYVEELKNLNTQMDANVEKITSQIAAVKELNKKLMALITKAQLDAAMAVSQNNAN